MNVHLCLLIFRVLFSRLLLLQRYCLTHPGGVARSDRACPAWPGRGERREGGAVVLVSPTKEEEKLP